MVSVIIPTYNRAYCIEKSITSVLNQTYRDLELIIVDDGSTDNTREVIENIKDDRIRYIYQENAGACAARNHGIDEAHGEYIAFHDSDDIWYPGKLEKQIKYMRSTDADFVFSSYLRQSDGKSEVVPDRPPKNNPLAVEDLLIRNYIGTPTIFIKADIAKKVLFDTDLKRIQDWEFSLHVLSQGCKVCFQNEVLMEAIVTQESITNSTSEVLAAAFETVFHKYYDIYASKKKYLSAAYRYLASCYRSFDRKTAEAYMKQSLECRLGFGNLIRFVLLKLNLW